MILLNENSLTYKCVAIVVGLFSFLTGMIDLEAAEDNVLKPDSKYVSLKVPLHDGRFIKLHDLSREVNEKLNENLPWQSLPNKSIEITPAEKIAIKILAATGWLDVSFEDDCIVLKMPNQEHPDVRRENREFFKKYFDVKFQEPVLHVPPNLNSTTKTVLIIHGLESSPKELRPIQRCFEKSGIQTLIYEYPNDGSLAYAGDELANLLTKFQTKHPNIEITIAAHSMGGLVARYCLENPKLDVSNVVRLVLLGTPNRGSDLVRGYGVLEFVLDVLPNVRTGTPLAVYQDGLGEAQADLTPDSRFLTILDGWEQRKDVDYFAAAGTEGFVNEEQFDQAVSILRRKLKGDAGSILTQRQLAILVDSKDELVGGLGDGAVSIESALAVSAKTNARFKRNHFDMILCESTDDELFKWILDCIESKKLER
tara:strand:+ start:439 stop:1713 length:1275 start_codon:yes stop_codon:yes gene_type:complete